MGSVLLCRVDRSRCEDSPNAGIVKIKDEGKVWRGNYPKEDCRLDRDKAYRVSLLHWRAVCSWWMVISSIFVQFAQAVLGREKFSFRDLKIGQKLSCPWHAKAPTGGHRTSFEK